MTNSPRVTVWNEYRHEKTHAEVARIYPDGIHEAIATHLRGAGLDVRTATLDEPEHGLTADVLAQTDVLIWWAHMAHGEVADEVVDRVYGAGWHGPDRAALGTLLQDLQEADGHDL